MKVYGNGKMLALLGLGIASGLPLFLVSKTLQAWLTKAGVDLGVIGAFSLVSLPYSLKFLWAPLLDRYHLPYLGRRRGWLLLWQGLLFLSILGLTFLQPDGFGAVTACGDWWCQLTSQLGSLIKSPFFLVALLIAFCSASQDITVDAYRTEILKEEEMGAGAAIFVLGYRFALVITGGLAFALAGQVAWGIVYRWLAPLMLIGIIITLLAPAEEPLNSFPSLSNYFIEPLGEFLQRPGWWLILLFVMVYKVGDGVVGNMSVPFLLGENGLGADEAQIGIIQSVGLVSTILGTLAGGSGVSRMGINRSLWVFGGLQAVSNFSYALLAWAGNNLAGIFVAINLENFCGGLGTAAFTAFLMSLCHRQFTATQYALLSSLFAVSRDILVAPGGEIVKTIGWLNFFLASFLISLPGLVLLSWIAPWHKKQ